MKTKILATMLYVFISICFSREVFSQTEVALTVKDKAVLNSREQIAKELLADYGSKAFSKIYSLTNLYYSPFKGDTTQEELTQKTIFPEPLGLHLREAGVYLRKAYKKYNPGLRTLDMIAKEENPYMGLFLALFILPFDYTFTRSKGKFQSAHYVGFAGGKFIDASTVISSKQAPFMNTAGQNLKQYRTYSYWSTGIYYSGFLVLATEAILKGSEARSGVLTAGGLAMLTGWGLGLVPLHYAGKAGKNLKEILEILPSEKERTLMEECGNGLQTFSRRSYWGRGLEALGITLAFAGQDNETMVMVGISTAIIGWIISDFVAPKGIKSAGEKLEELRNILIQTTDNQGQ